MNSILTHLGKAIGLPDEFLALKKGSKGGGVIQVMFAYYSRSRHCLMINHKFIITI